MRVFQTPQHMPVLAVVDVPGGVIAVHPDLDHEAAVAAIKHLMPDVHPDTVEHWVEQVLPTSEPLAMTVPLDLHRPPRCRRPPPRHRRQWRVAQAAASWCVAAVGSAFALMTVLNSGIASSGSTSDDIDTAAAPDLTGAGNTDQAGQADVMPEAVATIHPETASPSAENMSATIDDGRRRGRTPAPEPSAASILEEASPEPEPTGETPPAGHDQAAECEDLLADLLDDYEYKSGETSWSEAWREEVGPIHDKLADELCPLIDPEQLAAARS